MRSLIPALAGALACVAAASAQTETSVTPRLPPPASAQPGTAAPALPSAGVPEARVPNPPAVSAPRTTGSVASSGPVRPARRAVAESPAEPSSRQQALERKNDLLKQTIMRSVCSGC